MKKFDRVTSILILLQSRRVIKAQEIADRFEVTLRTVYRDIRTLQNAGIPIIGEAGVGYSIMEGYRLPPVQFTPEEATAFLLAEKLVAANADPGVQHAFTSAMDKIRAVLRSKEKDALESLQPVIAVSDSPSSFSRDIPKQFLPRILEAIKHEKVLKIEYQKEFSEVATSREIESIGIYQRSENWHLLAYCRLRQNYRDFRVDRIRSLLPTEQSFQKHDISLKDYFDQWSKSQTLTKVVVNFSKVAAEYTNNQKHYYGLVEQKVIGDHVQMTFLSPNLNHLARWLLMYGKRIDVQSPEAMREELQQLTKELNQHYLS